MKINYDSIYAEQSSVNAYPGADLTDMQEYFLDYGLKAFENYNLPNVQCGIENVSSGGFLKSQSTAALVMTAQFKAYTFNGIITVNPFGSLCVIGAYKLIDGQGVFDSATDPKEKRRIIIRKLSNIVSIDYFHALESSVDFVAGSIGDSISTAYSVYREQH